MTQESLGLIALLKSKEFKERVELAKKGGQLALKGGRIGGRLALKGSRFAFARGKVLFENWKLKGRE